MTGKADAKLSTNVKEQKPILYTNDYDTIFF